MTVINEEVSAQSYLLGYLGADATLMNLVTGIWTRSVPETAPLPVVKIDRQSSTDLMVVSTRRVWSDLSFLVRGTTHWVGSGVPDWTVVQNIANRIDQLLHGHTDITSTLEIASYREETFVDETIEGGQLFLHAGGIYRLRAHAL